jgi:hypothetical protein
MHPATSGVFHRMVTRGTKKTRRTLLRPFTGIAQGSLRLAQFLEEGPIERGSDSSGVALGALRDRKDPAERHWACRSGDDLAGT